VHILFLTQVLPFPLDAGPKVRAYYVLRYLAQFHRITLVSFVRPTDRPEAIAHLRQYCVDIYTYPMPRSKWLDATHLLRSLITGQPFIVTRDWVPSMRKLLANVVGKTGTLDAIHADQLWMAPYGLQAKGLLPQGLRPITILDQHNAVYMIPQRLMNDTRNPLKRALLQQESQKLARYEVDVCRQFDQVVWVTHEDAQAVQSQAPDTQLPVYNAGVIPICVDPEAVNWLQRKPNAHRVTFLGGLHYPPNAAGIEWFVDKVFPQVLAEAPDAVLTVIGKQPPPRLKQLGIPDANLEVTGYVADPMPYLEETAVFIVPLHAGGGMRVKILDAWASGLPVVSTTVGAEGIQILPGENILIADSPEAFAQATTHLMKNRQRGEYLAQAGRRWVEQHYTWRTTYRMWDQVYAFASRQPV
jgi:glycosyltransferase involved in cell wall biosynthesis